MGLQKLPSSLKMSDLFLDVNLVAVGELNNKVTDLTGGDTFSVGLWRENIGFGITDISIETSTNLQPIVDITFKDIYGNTVFGVLKNQNLKGSNIDYSILFDWPPPKFALTFKGYLGKPVTWMLNLKKATTQNNPTDGSYEIKATFVPNQWGFFADIPFLYLNAVKKLKEDINGSAQNLSPEQKKLLEDKTSSIFDLIKIGKRIEFRKKELTGEYDKLKNQLTVLRTNSIDGITNQLFNDGDKIDGSIPGRAAIPGFKPMTIVLHSGFDKNKDKRNEQIKNLKVTPVAVQAEGNKILALISTPNFISNLSPFGQKTFNTIGQVPTDPKFGSDFQSAKVQGQKIIDDNIKVIDDEVNRRLFNVPGTSLRSPTISEIFSQLGGDAAFILGSILDAGITGHQKNKQYRDTGDSSKKLIGRFFPLETGQNGEEVPAINAGINDDGAEMQFVEKFIAAISEGIAKNRRDEAALDTQLSSENKIIQRINNLEILSNNPYTGADAKRVMENILVRSGIATFITRSNDPNKPGDFGNKTTVDNDSTDEIRELADKELKNITNDVLTGLDDNGILELKKFCHFFNRLFQANGENLIDIDRNTGEEIDGPAVNGLLSIKDYEVVLNFTVKRDENGQSIGIENVESQKVLSFFTSNAAFLSLLFFPNDKNPDLRTPSLQRSIDIGTLEAKYLFHNNVLFTIPNAAKTNQYQFVIFNNTNDVSRLDSVTNNDSDSSTSSNDDKNKSEPLGIVKVTNAEPSPDNNPDLKRLETINDRIKNSLVLDYSKVNISENLLELPTDIKQRVKDTILVPKDSIIDNTNIGNGKSYIVYTHSWDQSEPDLVWGLFRHVGSDGKVDIRGRNQRVFIKQVCQSIENKLNDLETEKNNIISQVLGKASDNKNAIYRQMHHLFHQWQILGVGFDGKSEKAKPIALTLEGEYNRQIDVRVINGEKKIGIVDSKGNFTPSNTTGNSPETVSAGFRYDYPIERISPPPDGNFTIVANSIINLEPLYNPNANTTILNVIQQICTKNNFLFIPIPGYSDYTNITEIFKPEQSPVIPQVGNIFHVLFTPTPESRSRFNDDTPIGVPGIPEDSVLDAFEVEFGSPDNVVIKSIQANTDDNKPTAESILNLQRLVDKDNSNKAVTADCSLLSVMEGRSYKMSVEMLGNAQVSPMQFFVVRNAPIFGGLYQVMKVSHSITPNNMITRLEGMKMRFDNDRQVAMGVKPVTLESLKALGSPANVQQPATENAGNSPVNSSPPESIFQHSGGISGAFLQRIKDVKISNATDIRTLMNNITGQDFVDWFNNNMALKGPFAGKSIVSKSNFELFWNNSIPVLWDNNKNGSINFIEFLALNTIIINETGGLFIAKIPEKVNSITKPTSPGIAYAFDRIPGTKKSYNTLTDVSNKTALELFSDFHFKDAHGKLPFGEKATGLRDTTNSKWAGDKFPSDIFLNNLAKAVDPNSPTFINEADFFKFRGRGYIQVTGRSIYKSIIQFILNYKGQNTKINQYKNLWTSAPFLKNLDIIATRTSNTQWDDLFANTELLIAIRSIREHAEGAGRYQYIPDLNTDAGKVLDKVLNVARRISGNASEYVELYKNRILIQTDVLDKAGRV